MANSNAGEHASLGPYSDAVLSATDAASGITLSVEPNGTVLSAERAGKPLWAVDIIEAAGKPSTGFPVIRLVETNKPGFATVVVGKSRTVEVDLSTGAVHVLGED
ncbi:MAG: hypothetical protein KF914_06640 [Rhizobiaceae bacterium]|nr:hypothetical protein [Rhizobiaceae bacterium]